MPNDVLKVHGGTPLRGEINRIVMSSFKDGAITLSQTDRAYVASLVAQRTGLCGDPAAMDARDDVHAREVAGRVEGLPRLGLESLTRGMMARGADMWAARREALTILDRQLTAQASVIAYSRIYMLSALLILCLIPLLLLVRQTKGAGGGHAVME